MFSSKQSLASFVSVPILFHEVLHTYTVKGFRVIALAHKSLPPKLSWAQAQRITR